MPIHSRLVSYVVGGLLIASGLAHLAILLGGSSWSGPLSLRKPMTFGLSFGITLITITWVSAFLNLRARTRAGFVLLCAAMAVGGVMIGIGMRHVFAGNAAAAYATGGALKPTHAIAMHGILVLPMLGTLLARTDWSEDRRLRVMRHAAAGCVVFAVVVGALNVIGLV